MKFLIGVALAVLSLEQTEALRISTSQHNLVDFNHQVGLETQHQITSVHLAKPTDKGKGKGKGKGPQNKEERKKGKSGDEQGEDEEESEESVAEAHLAR